MSTIYHLATLLWPFVVYHALFANVVMVLLTT